MPQGSFERRYRPLSGHWWPGAEHRVRGREVEYTALVRRDGTQRGGTAVGVGRMIGRWCFLVLRATPPGLFCFFCVFSAPVAAETQGGRDRYGAPKENGAAGALKTSTDDFLESGNSESAQGAAQVSKTTTEQPATRSLRIVSLEVRGRRKVSPAQITGILETEGLREGTRVLWPEDERVARARARLAATGYFSKVTMRLRPVPQHEDQVKLAVELHERGSLTLEAVYAGSSQMTAFHGGAELLERNLLGRAIHVGGAAVWGTAPDKSVDGRRQQAYRLMIEFPGVAGRRLGMLTSAYYSDASDPYRVAGARDAPNPALFQTVEFRRIGALAGVTLGLAQNLTLGIDYRFEAVQADLPDDPTWTAPDGGGHPLDLNLRSGRHRMTTTELSLAWDGRDDRHAVLGRGGRIRIDVDMSSPAIGSNYEYIKVLVGGAYTFGLPWRHRFTLSAHGGQISGTPPRFERFHPGDFADWTTGREMGLVYSTRAPIDVLGTGVDEYALVNYGGRFDLEYAFPLFRRARTRLVYGGYFFVSTGVFMIAGDDGERRYRLDEGLIPAPIGYNANLGFRLETSVGAIDLSVGNVLRRLPF